IKPYDVLSVASGAARVATGGAAAVRVRLAGAAAGSLCGSSEIGPLLRAGAAFGAAGVALAWSAAFAAGAAWPPTGLALTSPPSGRMGTVRTFFGSFDAPGDGAAFVAGAPGVGRAARGAAWFARSFRATGSSWVEMICSLSALARRS